MATETDTLKAKMAAMRHKLGPGNYRRIGRLSGFSHQHISSALRGENGLSLDSAAMIARAAGVSLDNLHRYIRGVRREREERLERLRRLRDEKKKQQQANGGSDSPPARGGGVETPAR
jgi:transcriptional regulator with XRE-family HTH domain